MIAVKIGLIGLIGSALSAAAHAESGLRLAYQPAATNQTSIPFVPPVQPGTVFETDFNDMTVSSWTEGNVTGRYEYGGGRIEGVPRGRVVTGYWLQEASPTDCGVRRGGTQHWGRFTFTFSEDGRTFTGQWGDCDDTPHKPWNGQIKG